MESLNKDILEYKLQLSKGQIQKAYKGIMTFMSELRSYLENRFLIFRPVVCMLAIWT